MTACANTPAPSGNDAICSVWAEVLPSVSAEDSRQTREEVKIERKAFEEVCPDG